MKRYIPTIESETSMPTGNVGWWFLESYNAIWPMIGDRFLVDGYIMYDSLVPTIGEHSGVVIYDIRSQVYEIICHPNIASDDAAIKIIADTFGISDLRYDVIPCDGHYKLPISNMYTGIKELVDFED